MSDKEQSPKSTETFPPALQAAIDKFNKWADEHLSEAERQNAIGEALYHYTDGRGLKGIFENQTIWFTDYRHLNDPSELVHGMEMARDVMHFVANGADGRLGLFLELFADMFSQRNFSAALEFFIASFSKQRDDLGQWRSYADNGRGYAIGFAPHLFAITDDHGLQPNEKVVVGPVLYRVDQVIARHQLAIDEAAAIFLEAVTANADLIADKTIGLPFMQEFARAIIASPLIWNCLTSKHPAYEHEQEVRLIILGLRERLMPYIKTRLRGSEIVPYVVHDMPLRRGNNIAEIVVGPAAPPEAERSVHTLLTSLGVDPIPPISRSDIPYRVV